MKTQENRTKEQRHLLFQADLEATINALFRRCPTLCGFSVRDATDQLFITEVSVYPMRDLHPPAELGHEIVTTLAELLEECPEACALLRDRTFARVLH